jgi:hypothetical protein
LWGTAWTAELATEPFAVPWRWAVGQTNLGWSQPEVSIPRSWSPTKDWIMKTQQYHCYSDHCVHDRQGITSAAENRIGGIQMSLYAMSKRD